MPCYQILAIVCLPKMVCKKIQTFICNNVRHACSLAKTKVESRKIYVNKLSVFFQMQASSDPVSLNSDASICIKRL